MHILITGANGFMGKNLTALLMARQKELSCTLHLVDVDTSPTTLQEACNAADFVFHLAGVNRPTDETDFQRGNGDFTATLLAMLAKHPPVVLTSSIQAAIDNPYGRSKRSAEEALQVYAQKTGAPVYLYRLANAFGKWGRPNYNSAVATFCHNIARGLPIQVHNPETELRLVYIDDILEEFLRALQGTPTKEGAYCVVQPEYHCTLGVLSGHLHRFFASRHTLDLVDQSDPFVKKLYATFLSYLPPEGFSSAPTTHTDARGSFTELLHMGGYGQISVNVSLPHITKGEHWHQTKNEKFIVVSGHGVIRFRQATGGELLEYPVSGDAPSVVDIPPGYTHNIENLGDIPMVTLMWASEAFNPARPDTFPLQVSPDKPG